MNSAKRYWLCFPAAILAIIVAGCSQIEPQTGTKITFTIDASKPLTRPQVSRLSRYLVEKSSVAVGADRARVDSVKKSSIVLLLPGTEIGEQKAGKLLESGRFEFVHLTNVQTAKHPDRPWQVSLPKGKQQSWIFTGPDGQRLDSAEDRDHRIKAEVVTEDYQPILTDKDLKPDAVYQQAEKGWAILIRFTQDGAKKLEQFSSANRGEYLAVFDRDRLISAAEISDVINGGQVFLPGFSSEEQVDALVTDINGGDLPSRLQVVSVEHY